MKKLIATLLALAMVLSMAACAATDSSTASTEDAEPNSTSSTGPDGSAEPDNFVKPEGYALAVLVTINPQFVLYLDAEGNVLAVRPVNEDARALTLDKTEGSLEEVVETIIRSASESNYLPDDGNMQIAIAESTLNEDAAYTLLERAVEAGTTAGADIGLVVETTTHWHEYNETPIEPTCTEPGAAIHACYCGDSYIDQETDALGHSWGEWVTVREATEDAEGSAERTCSVCSEKLTRTLPKVAPDHSHSYEETVTEPTCTEKGHTTYSCSCGDIYTANETPATGHSHTEAVTAPTCTDQGYSTFTCICGDTYTGNETPAKGHAFVNEICADCGKIKEDGDGLVFTLNDDGESYAVTDIGTCADLDIVIPAAHQGLPVTRIGRTAFYECTNVTSITLPDTVTSIGYEAFYSCSGLISVNIPNSVTIIEEGAFSGCSSLAAITIPTSVKVIEPRAFQECASLTKITIPSSIGYLDVQVFYGCTSLTTVSISFMSAIDLQAFAGCSSLTYIRFSGTMDEWEAVEKSEEWDADTGEYTIYCRDGMIKK